jgi:hypothetical protein
MSIRFFVLEGILKKCKKTDDLLHLGEGLGEHGLAQAKLIWSS